MSYANIQVEGLVSLIPSILDLLKWYHKIKTIVRLKIKMGNKQQFTSQSYALTTSTVTTSHKTSPYGTKSFSSWKA
jgi:hypothetical protein